MPFNRGFNVQDQVNDLYPSVRRTVLFSLVGAINATLIQAADTLVQRIELVQEAHGSFDTSIENIGGNLCQMSVADVEKFMRDNGPDTGPTDHNPLQELRALYALGDVLRGELRHLSPNDTDGDDEAERPGSLYGTIAFMTGKQRQRPIQEGAVEVLKALDIELTAAQVLAAQRNMQTMDQARADARAKRRGGIEWLIENVFSNRDATISDGDYFAALPIPRRELLTTKFFGALKGALNQAVQNTLFGRTGDMMLGAADIPMIRDTIVTLTKDAYPPSEPKEVKTVRRVTKAKAASAAATATAAAS